MDEQVVRLHPDIAAAAEKFVRVRLVRIAGVDLRLFDFDHDLTWYAFFLNADETVYGRYGGRDASSPDARLSLKGLRHALERALEAHRNPPAPEPRPGPPPRAEDYPAARSFKDGCIHCHNVNEFRRADLQARKQWTRDDLWVYPLPENLGLTLDVDVGDRVKVVQPGSPAAKAGLQTGDRLRSLNGRPVASFADATYALHKSPLRGTIPVAWERQGRRHEAELALTAGWRKTNLTWRPSLLDLLPSLPVSGDDLIPAEKRRLGLAPARAALRQGERVHSTLRDAGLQAGDVIIGFDGQAIEGTMDDLLGFVRRNYLVGDRLTINVLRLGQPATVSLLLK